MNTLQKLGGWAGLIHALAYLVAMVLMVMFVMPARDAGLDSYVAFVSGNRAVVDVLNFFGYWVAAATLVVMVLALYERLKVAAPAGAQVAAAFGLIWAALIIGSGNLMLRDSGVLAGLYAHSPAQAASTWVILEAVENGITSGNEIVGSLWVLLVCWMGWRTGLLGRALSGFGLAISLAGLLTVIPAFFTPMVAVFGPGMIVWSVWVGITLLRSQPAALRQANTALA